MGYNFDVEKQTENVVNWTRDWMNSKGENSIMVIAISGGVDSSTIAAIGVKAIGKDRVVGVKIPCGVQKDIDYSNELIEHLGIKAYEINIGEMYENLTNQMRQVSVNGNAFPTEQYSTNTPARLRMATVYGVAAMLGNAYPANSCQMSETSQGYDTIFGDSAGSLAPIAMFTKTEVRAIAKCLGLPERLYNKVPIDGMSLNKDGSYKSDEDKLGFTYDELDAFLREHTVGPNNEKIVKGMKANAWKRRIISIEHYDPKLPFPAQSLW